MVQQKKVITLLFFFLMHAGALHGILRGRTFFSPRPQGAYLSHAISGYQPNFMRLHDKDDACASTHRFSLAGHYQRLYRGEHRAEYYFGTECLTFSGSRVDGRGRDDILADYFGLSTDFKSIVQFKPTISTGSVEFGFDYWNVGSSDGKEWYLRVRAPLVVTAWDMGLCEHAREEGENNYPAGYMSSELIEHSGLNTSVREAWAGERAIGDIQPLRYGKLRGEQKETALADITVDLGVRPVYDDEYYFGMHARVVAPTGTRPQGCYLFEPVAGNGRHWELGFGLQGFALLHEDEVGSHRFELYGEMNITHLFAAHQKRSYDFKANGVMSRYMLIQELGTPVVEGYTDDNDVMLEHQYHGKLMPAINKTTLDSEVTVGVQVDMALKIGYSHKCIIGDFGYNLWARSEEHVVCRERFSKNCFGIKGDGQVYGFTLQGDNFVGLNATQQFATIHAGQPDGSASNQFANDNADNKVLTRFLGDELQQSKAPFTATGITAAEQVSGSQESVFISDCDLDNAGAMTPMGISHTLFATIGYRWQDADPVEPYLLVGGEIEYDGTSRRRRSALSQWGVWLEAGFVY